MPTALSFVAWSLIILRHSMSAGVDPCPEDEAEYALTGNMFPYSDAVHWAARVLQRYYGKRHMRRCTAQIQFARVFRGHLVRRGRRRELARKHAAATRIIRAWARYR